MEMKQHWPEYLSEFLGTGLMVFIGLSAVAWNFGSGSPMESVLPSPRLRLLLTACLFAGGGTAVVHSPLGRRSGGHLNPAVTLGFWLMGKVRRGDAFLYMLAQTAGAVAGTFLVKRLWGALALSTQLGLTLPGRGIGTGTAFLVETVITLLLMGLILEMLARPSSAPYTGLAAGALVVGLVYFSAPFTGASLNPARSLGPAALMRTFHYYWIYLLAPPLGSAMAVFLFRRKWRRAPTSLCAKIFHPWNIRCIFCGHVPPKINSGGSA